MITTAAASVVISTTLSGLGTPDAEVSTWPNARTCAPAHITELGTITNTASFSARGPKRWRNKSPSVVKPLFHSGTASNSDMSSKHSA